MKPVFPADAFVGTAPYYLRYRVPFPRELLRDLTHRAAITGAGRLLDLASGPGRIALALASSFNEVWAVDIEPEMIAEGKKEAARRGANNIKWMIGMAEDVVAPSTSFELVTIGDAFHRLDQRRVAEQSRQWLKSRGCLAILGGYGMLCGKEPWQRIVMDVVRKWTGRSPPIDADPPRPKPDGSPEHAEAVLRELGFVEVASHPFLEPLEWTTETIKGFLYSTSVSSVRALGANRASFEAELKAALLECDASGRYRESMQFGYTFGRKKG